VELCRFRGALLSLPRNIDVRVLWANCSLLGARSVPESWEQLADSGLAFGFPGRESGRRHARLPGAARMKLTRLDVFDLRAPTSRTLAGSDAVHGDPDYSAAYVILESDAGLAGHGLTFTIGRGTEVVCAAVRAFAPQLLGRELEEITADFGAFHRRLTNESQLRWLGPEKGVIHLATAALVNALWDLWAKREQKPVWKLVADLPPEEIVRLVDWRYLTDALTLPLGHDLRGCACARAGLRLLGRRCAARRGGEPRSARRLPHRRAARARPRRARG
jgi:L-alanine-DL-glutamate epimerase-like enolase superfamily enzyme